MKFVKALTTAAFCLCVLVACGTRSSDEQQVRELISGVEAAAEKRDASDVLDYVADDYQDANGFDRIQLRNFLRGYFLAHPKVELLVSVEQLAFPADGLAQAEVSLTSLSFGNPDRARLKVEFRRQGGKWLVSRADRESG